jgi:hypothetical protein
MFVRDVGDCREAIGSINETPPETVYFVCTSTLRECAPVGPLCALAWTSPNLRLLYRAALAGVLSRMDTRRDERV